MEELEGISFSKGLLRGVFLRYECYQCVLT
jgi:hypothetical protein